MVNDKLLMVNRLPEMPKYEAYKDSGVEWLGEIPESWFSKKTKYLCWINKKSLPENTKAEIEFEYVDIGNVSFENGVGLVQKFSFRNAPSRARRLAKEGDTVISTVRTYLKAIDHIDKSKMNYVFSTGFAVLEPKRNFFPHYLTEFVKSNAFTNQVDEASNGISYPAINSTQLSNLFIAVPSLQEQTAIANFLDQKTTQIDQAIAIKEKQIELLKERKQILIQNAVTRGLDKNAPMKDSGVEWIGEIPEHWDVKRAKYLFNEIDERSERGEEELLSVSHLTGVTPRSEKSVTMIAEDYTGSKTCQENDFIMNIMWAWMGALGVTDRKGIVSSAYSIFRQNPLNIFNPYYLEWLMKTVGYIEHYNKVSTGLHSSRLRFYSRMFFDMKIGYPERKEQNEIVEFIQNQLTNLDKAVQLQKQQIKKLKEYKSTLINSAVTGKIKVT